MAGVVGPVLAGLLTAAELVAVVLAARRLGRWFDPTGDAWDRALAAVVAGLAGTVGLLTVAGMTGLLRRPLVALLVIGAAAAVLVLVPDPGRPTRTTESQPSLGVRAALAALCGAALVCFLAPGLAGRTQESDSLHYHVPNLGSWLHRGHLWALPYAVPGYFTNAYPSVFELTGALLLAPTGSDQLLYVTVLPWLALTVLAVTVATRELDGNVTAGVLMGLAVLLTPLVVRTQAAALTSDVAASGALVAGVALVLRARTSESVRRVGVLAGLALGLAVACKYTTYAGAVGVLVLALLLLRGERRRTVTIAMIGTAAALGGFWLVRNVLATGNPVYPLALGPLDGGESPLTRYDLPLLSHIVHWRSAPLDTWWRLARTLYGPVLLLVPVAVVALLRPARRATFMVGGLVVALAVAYTLAPYTGGGHEGVAFLIGSQLRYALPAVVVAAPVAAALLGRVAVPAAVVLLAWDVWHLREKAGFRTDVDLHGPTVAWAVALAAVAGGLVLLLPHARDRLDQLPRPVMPVAGAVAVAIGIAGVLHVQGDQHPYPSERLLVRLGEPHGPIAVAYVGDVRTLAGRRFDVELVSPNAGGAADEKPVLDARALDRALLASPAKVLAVDRGSAPTLPAGWHPSAVWTKAATQGRTEIYVRTGS